MIQCEIIRDLMPNYIDEMTSAKSNQEIEKHLETCDKCRKYHDSMKKTLHSELSVKITPDEIQPFKKVKKALNIRNIVLIIFIVGFIGSVIYGQYENYYLYGRDADIDDVRIEYEAAPLGDDIKLITLCYQPTKEHISLAVGYQGVPTDYKEEPLEKRDENNIYMGVIKYNISPFAQDRISYGDTWEYWFLNEDTLYDVTNKEEIKLTGKEKLVIGFAADKSIEIRIKDLYTGEGLDAAGIITNSENR